MMTKFLEVVVRPLDEFNVAIQIVDDSKSRLGFAEVVSIIAFADCNLTRRGNRKRIRKVLASEGIRLTPTLGREINKIARELVCASKTSPSEVRCITVAMLD